MTYLDLYKAADRLYQEVCPSSIVDFFTIKMNWRTFRSPYLTLRVQRPLQYIPSKLVHWKCNALRLYTDDLLAFLKTLGRFFTDKKLISTSKIEWFYQQEKQAIGNRYSLIANTSHFSSHLCCLSIISTSLSNNLYTHSSFPTAGFPKSHDQKRLGERTWGGGGVLFILIWPLALLKQGLGLHTCMYSLLGPGGGLTQ